MEMEKPDVLKILAVALPIITTVEPYKKQPDRIVHALMLLAARFGREAGFAEKSLVAQFQEWQRVATMDHPLTDELIIPHDRLARRESEWPED